MKKKTAQTTEIESLILAWDERCHSDLIRTIDEILQEKNSQISALKKKIETLNTDRDAVYQSVHISGSFEDQFLLFTTNKRYLYEFLYNKLSPDEKTNVFRSLLKRFPFMPQVSRNELQERKRCGLLQPHEEEVYDAINKFQSSISSGKRR
jgi:tRNA splicing ligase